MYKVMEKYFSSEKEFLINHGLSEYVEILNGYFANIVPKYFYGVGASSSGKYHPEIDAGLGGLVRHTQMTCKVYMELTRLEFLTCGLTEGYIGAGLISCIIHDSFKNGEIDIGHTDCLHPINAAEKFYDYVKTFTTSYKLVDKYIIYIATTYHMGQWGPHLFDDFENIKEDSIRKIAELVHLADYIASRKFFDIKKEDLYNITEEEYENILIEDILNESKE